MLDRAISEKGIYPAVDPLGLHMLLNGYRPSWREHYNVAT